MSDVKYDFKSKELLQIDDFENIDCLVDDIIKSVRHLRVYEGVTVYGKAEFIQGLLYNLFGKPMDFSNNLSLSCIDFDGECIDYSGEYILTVTYDYKIWIEPARNIIGGFKVDESTLTYCYEEDIEQDVIEHLKKYNTPTLLFGFDG